VFGVATDDDVAALYYRIAKFELWIRFQLAYSDIQHHYHIQDIAFCVKKKIERTLIHYVEDNIFKITARMDIYRLLKFCTSHAYLPSASIQYDIKDQYLAITRDAGYYIELSTEDYLHCSGNEFKKKPL
jgi:hypothetical protein